MYKYMYKITTHDITTLFRRLLEDSREIFWAFTTFHIKLVKEQSSFGFLKTSKKPGGGF